MNQPISENRDEISRLCRAYGVVRLDVFGSAVGGEFGDDSDLDFLVVFSREEGANAFHQYFDFKEALSRLLGREIDLICDHAIKNPIFKREVEATRQPLYAA